MSHPTKDEATELIKDWVVENNVELINMKREDFPPKIQELYDILKQ